VSFVVAALCGRAVMDHALASTSMLYGLKERDYADDLLVAFDIDRKTLPEIDDATAEAGRLTARGAELTGLAVGTPVAVGTGDDFANAIGGGVVEPGIVNCNIGTGEAVGAVSDEPLIDAGGLVETHGYLGGRFYVSNPGWLSGGAVAVPTKFNALSFWRTVRDTNATWYSAQLPETETEISFSSARSNDQSFTLARRSTTSSGCSVRSIDSSSMADMPFPGSCGRFRDTRFAHTRRNSTRPDATHPG